MNRETWLEALTVLLRPAFDDAGKTLPAIIKVSCGFPSTGAKSKRVGEHHRRASFDERSEIFISPVENNSLEVAGILLHELCHAALPSGTKHGPEFKKLATDFGLEGRMTATKVGSKAEELLSPLIQELGQYPHDELVTGQRVIVNEQAKLMTVRCEDCGFRALMEQDDYVVNGYRLECPAGCGEPLLHKKDR